MRLVTFEARNRPSRARLGVLVDNDTRVVDVGAVDGAEALRSMQALIEAGDEALARLREVVADVTGGAHGDALWLADAVHLLAPLPRPLSLRDSLLFETHYKGAFEAIYRRIAAEAPNPDAAFAAFERAGKCRPPEHWYKRPTFSYRNHLAIVGPDADIRWAYESDEMDYELEIGCIVGKPGRDIDRSAAAAHIFGYSILNDFTARDVQRRTIQTGRGYNGASKDFDTGYALGPCIVTPDEIDDVYDLTMVARVNGEEWSRGSSRTIHHTFEALIEAVSIETTIHPGELLGSGTMGGGCGLELGRYLNDGDIVEIEIEKIGILRNRLRRHGAG